MPLDVDKLTADSPMTTIRQAINKSYEQCMREGGKTPEECGGMIYGIAREKTGKSLERQ